MRDEPLPTSDQTTQSSDSTAGNDSSDAGVRSDARNAHSSDEPLYVISVAAKLVGMPAWTLRVLDEQAIVSPKRTDKNRRLYSDLDLMRLARVRTLTEVDGVNMNGVRLILRLEDEHHARKGE
jgi:MerR family transcriptional regulator, heat shock protein HspR